MPSAELSIIIALLLIVLAIQILLFRKIRRIDIKVWEVSEVLPREILESFRQSEALASLYWELKPQSALPPTRGWAGSPDFLREVARHALDSKPVNVIECSSGVSTLILALCLRKNGVGHIFSLEHAPEYAEATRKLLVRHGVSEWATVIDAPLIETTTDLGTQPWYDLSGLKVDKADLIVVDGPPMDTAPLARYPAGPKLLPKLHPEGKLFLDDSMRPEERKITARWIENNPRLAIQNLPCEKGLATVYWNASPL